MPPRRKLASLWTAAFVFQDFSDDNVSAKDILPSAALPATSRRKRILFTIVTVVLLGFFAEASLQVFYRLSVGRWLWQWWAIPIFAPDPVRVYRVKANLDYLHRTSEFTARYMTDALGLRAERTSQPAPLIPKPDDTFRVLAFGPSFAFGWGVNYEDAYIHRIVEGLHAPGKRVELMNLGTPSQPIPYQLKWLKAVGYRYAPDLIVQTVYGEMQDMESDDTLPDVRPGVRNGYLYPSDKMTFSLWIRRMRTYSAALFYGWHAYHALLRSQTDSGDGREFYRKAGPANAGVDEVVHRYKRYLDFVGDATTNKPQVVFLFVPMAHVVRPSDVTRVAHHGALASPNEVREKARLLTGALFTNHVNMINPTDVLVEHDKATRMYNLYDIHFTVAGNKVVADYSLPRIQDMLRDDRRGSP